MKVVRQHIRVTGVVQGVGFRPFVWRTAEQFQCTGWVRNSSFGVEMELQGNTDAVLAIVDWIKHNPPPLAVISFLGQCDMEPVQDEAGFQILESRAGEAACTFVSPDMATCADCLNELTDPLNRRFKYPFINCTHCGPRFTIQQSIPYDRSHTTMGGFAMCGLCRAEYESPGDRRFHAQPNACHECGPAIWFVEPLTRDNGSDNFVRMSMRPPRAASMSADAMSAEAIELVRQAISIGKIVAIKGIGGFHLACDARQREAVMRLRQRKQRPFKPLAVMVRDMETAASLVHLSSAECQILSSPQRPIVLLRKRDGVELPDELAPNNPDLGVLLPYSPLHHLLLQVGDAWVMTSGNLADEPIAFDNTEALLRLHAVADCFLLHDRPIHAVCDDSVLRWSTLGAIPIRRSRGFAPLPVDMQQDGPAVLAMGAELKNTICLATGQHAFIGQHIGDMGHAETLQAVERCHQHLQLLYETEPVAIATDQHPGYLSSHYAEQLANSKCVPLIRVQHHHAHAAALIAEHGLPADQSIIACVMDGTGYGSDGAIWGGEILIANSSQFQRAAHLEYSPLPGGDQCILYPARTALAYLHGAGIPWSADLPCVQFFQSQELKLLKTQLDKRINTVPTSSLGRLFDAVASLIGLRHEIDYEGQAAMELEYLAESIEPLPASQDSYSRVWSDSYPSRLQLAVFLQEVQSDLRTGASTACIAFKFHQTLALAIAEQCQTVRRLHQDRSLNRVGLTGGVFQNALLLRLTHAALSAAGFEVWIHRIVPPNDGGLALGQACIARALIQA